MKESLGVYNHEDGHLTCKRRLGRGKLPFDRKLSILLPNSNHFIDLVTQSAHEKVNHNGVRETLQDRSVESPKVEKPLREFPSNVYCAEN